MAKFNSSYTVALHQSIRDVPAEAWDSVAARDRLFLSRRYLRCVEDAATREVEPWYAMITSADGAPAGIATLQVARFVGNALSPELQEAGWTKASLARRLLNLGQPLSMRVVVCGSTFQPGENGFALANGADPDAAMAALVEAVESVAAALEHEPPIGFVFKEFYPSSEPVVSLLADHRFHRLEAGSAMILGLDPQWATFDDYLASLTSKYRVKAKRAYAKSQSLSVRPLAEDDILHHQERLGQLYDAVIERADYRLGRQSISALASLRANLGEEFVIQGYFHRDQLVGFLTAFDLGETFETHLVGFDYTLNREISIYPRMLYDYLRIALERGRRKVNYGRTANEIKSTVGAVPVAMDCYVRHRTTAFNRLLPAVLRTISPPEFALRRPFKQTWYDNRALLISPT